MAKRVRRMQVSKEVMKIHGAEFKRLRESIGWDKVQMGKALGVDQATIRRWENAEAVPQRDLYDIRMDMEKIVKEEKRNVSR